MYLDQMYGSPQKMEPSVSDLWRAFKFSLPVNYLSWGNFDSDLRSQEKRFLADLVWVEEGHLPVDTQSIYFEQLNFLYM